MDNANITMTGVFLAELQYELDMHTATPPTKSKVVLAVIELLGLGVLGVDRCYTGQVCIGIVKGLTFGGLAVWAILDYLGVVITCLSMSSHLNAMGMRASFEGTTQNVIAFVMVLLIWPLMCQSGLRRVGGITSPRAPPELDEGDLQRLFYALDTNAVGRLSREVVRNELLKQGLPNKEVDRILRQIPADENGAVDYLQVASIASRKR